MGRLLSLFFSVVMIAMALIIDFIGSQEAIENVQTTMLSILGGGILSLFLLGFLTRRVGSQAACVATMVTVLVIGAWLLLETPFAQERFPTIAKALPDTFWVGVLANALLFSVGYAASWFLPNPHETELDGLTVVSASE